MLDKNSDSFCPLTPLPPHDRHISERWVCHCKPWDEGQCPEAGDRAMRPTEEREAGAVFPGQRSSTLPSCCRPHQWGSAGNHSAFRISLLSKVRWPCQGHLEEMVPSGDVMLTDTCTRHLTPTLLTSCHKTLPSCFIPLNWSLVTLSRGK